ncbi:MAG: hypothetical protein ABIR37_00610 [Candidatus Saccharimonadales bacterium]
MSEQQPIQDSGYAEKLTQLEHQTAGETIPEIAEHASAEQSPAAQAEQLSEVRSEVAAIPEIAPATNLTEPQPAASRPQLISKELRTLTSARSLTSIRNRLPLADKALSAVVHQPVVRVMSDVTAKTVARPAALFTGGLLAFVGSSLYLYLASHIGFTYNYVVAGLFFAAGFVLGIVIEGIFTLISRAKR